VPKPVPAAADQWYLQADGGEKFGPVSKADLDGWLEDGRIDASCQILCEGWEEWKWAEDVYPQLAQTPVESDAPTNAATADSPWVDDIGGAFSTDNLVRPAARASHRPGRSRRQPKSLGDFFDFGFRFYLTPRLIKLSWCISVFSAFALIVLVTISAVWLILSESIRGKPVEAIGLVIFWFIFVLMTFSVLVTIRVAFESVMVLFNIADSLESIDHKTKAT
jgi:hypothetical protein